jgi:hypothetical protein
MIIEISGAPKMKNIKLDISFEDDGEQVVNIVQDGRSTQTTKKPHKDSFQDSVLDLDEEFAVEQDVVVKPVIEETPREASVSQDMQDAEY